MSAIGSVFASVIGWVGDVVTAITESPLLFLFVIAVPLVGIAVGLFNRIIRSN